MYKTVNVATVSSDSTTILSQSNTSSCGIRTHKHHSELLDQQLHPSHSSLYVFAIGCERETSSVRIYVGVCVDVAELRWVQLKSWLPLRAVCVWVGVCMCVLVYNHMESIY